MQNSDIILFEIEKLLQHSKINRQLSDIEWISSDKNMCIESIESYRRNIIENIKDFVLSGDYHLIMYIPDIEKPQRAIISLLNRDKICVDLIDYFAYIISALNIWVELEKKLAANELI